MILSLVFQENFELVQAAFGLLDLAAALAVAADPAADRANPLAALRTEGLRGERQVQLFEDHLPEVDLSILVEQLVEVLLVELVPELVKLLGEENQVELAIDRVLEGGQAPAADEAQAGGDPPLDPDIIADPLHAQVGMDGLEENDVLVNQLGVQKIEIPADFQAVVRQPIYIYQHDTSLKVELLYHLAS